MESTGLLLFWTVGSECRPLGEPLGGPGLVDSNRQPLSATLESHIHPCLPLLFPVSLLSSAFLPSLLPSSSFFPLSFFSPLLRFVPHRPWTARPASWLCACWQWDVLPLCGRPFTVGGLRGSARRRHPLQVRRVPAGKQPLDFFRRCLGDHFSQSCSAHCSQSWASSLTILEDLRDHGSCGKHRPTAILDCGIRMQATWRALGRPGTCG